MYFFWRFISFIVYSNIFISIAAFLFTVETYLLLNQKIKFQLPLFIFCATLFAYNFHRGINAYRKNLNISKYTWVLVNLFPFITIILLSSFSAFVLLFFLHLRTFIVLLPLIFITLGYSIPFIKRGSRLVRLRDISFFKIFYISIVWGTLTVILPSVEIGISLWKADILLRLLERILFVFAITIPFDIRDRRQDMTEGLKTLPILLGEKKAKNLALICLLLYMGLIVLHYTIISAKFYFIFPLIISALIAMILVYKSSEEKHEFYFSLFTDGTILLQAVLVMITYYLFAY